MKTIYFVQHGLACSSEENTTRPLTKAGEKQVMVMVDFLKAQRIPVRHLRHSGKLRAQQTADIFAQALDISDNRKQDGMNPNDDPAVLAESIKDDATMYVGHLPQLSRLVSLLLCGDAEQTLVRFQNAGVVCLTLDDDSASLQWYLTPALIKYKLL
jgi:phosphohistidine phosphatase